MHNQTTSNLIIEMLAKGKHIRREELYALIPEKSQSSLDKTLQKLKKSGRIECVDLPDQYGSFFRLTQKGGDMLIDKMGFLNKTPPKKTKHNLTEETTPSTPPRHWLHHILSCQVLAALAKHFNSSPEIEIIFENQIRKDYPYMEKIPDGIVLLNSTSYVWLEIENIQKTGGNLLNLCDILLKFNQNRMPLLYGRECCEFVLGFPQHHEFCVSDLQGKIYESYIGDFSFIVLPLEMQSGKIKAGEPTEINLHASGSDILYNKLNKKIFSHDRKNYDSTPNREIQIYEFDVAYKLTAKNFYEWSISNSYYAGKEPLKTGVSPSLESCKKDFCAALAQITNGNKVTLDEIFI